MSFNLYRRIDEMLKQTRRQRAEPNYISLNWQLFTPAEQDQVSALLSLIDYQLEGLALLTGEQREKLHTWLQLQDALDRKDTAAVAHYRQRLAVSLEQLLAAFLAIAEQDVPDFADAPHREIEGVHYTFCRTLYRAMRDRIERERARGNLLPSSIDDMYMWVEAYDT